MSTDVAKGPIPTVLILSGVETGFASALLTYLWDTNVEVEHRRAGHIRLVDRYLFIPARNIYLRGWLHPDARKVLEQGHGTGIEYIQGNLSNADTRQSVFRPPESTGKEAYDVVFDLTGFCNHPSSSEDILVEALAKQAALLGQEALKRGGVRAYVRLVDPYVTMPKSKCPLSEDDTLAKPTVLSSKWCAEGTRALAAMRDLPLIVVRSAQPWGPGALIGLTRPLIIASIYKYLGNREKMEFLWGKDLVREHVHVEDLAAAMHALARWQLDVAKSRKRANELARSPLGPCRPAAVVQQSADGDKSSEWDRRLGIDGLVDRDVTVYAPVFHVSDGSGTTQGDIRHILEESMGIKIDYVRNATAYFYRWNVLCQLSGRELSVQHSALTNALAKMHLSEVVEIAEERHAGPWLDMLSESNPPIANTPLSAVLPASELQKNRCHLDTRKIQSLTGWQAHHPTIDVEEVKRCIDGMKKDGIWPNAAPRK